MRRCSRSGPIHALAAKAGLPASLGFRVGQLEAFDRRIKIDDNPDPSGHAGHDYKLSSELITRSRGLVGYHAFELLPSIKMPSRMH